MVLTERISRLFLLTCSTWHSQCGKIQTFGLGEPFRLLRTSWIGCPSLQLPLTDITHVKGRAEVRSCIFLLLFSSTLLPWRDHPKLLGETLGELLRWVSSPLLCRVWVQHMTLLRAPPALWGEHTPRHPVRAEQKDTYVNKHPFRIRLKLSSYHVASECWWKRKAQSGLSAHQPDPTYTCTCIYTCCHVKGDA